VTDDLDPRLRSRLAALAQAVPVAADQAPALRLTRPVTRSRVSGFSALGTAIAVVIVAGLAVVVAGRDGPTASALPAPTGSASAVASATSPASRSPTTEAASSGPSPIPTRPPADLALPYPAGCSAYGLLPRRCAYIVDSALAEAGATASTATVELLGDPMCVGQPAGCIVMRLGGRAFVVRVRVEPATGQPSDHLVVCGRGGESSLACTDTPLIRVSTPIAGYHDVPCGAVPAGEPGSHCATPVPTIAPSAADKALALRVPRLAIAIDHIGTYTVDVGDAVLPNGILTQATATLADDQRSDVIVPQGIQLQVLGPDGKPLENAYAQGWRAGTETVHVRLVFTVASFDPGSTLVLTDIVVR
jgi:hypothetical protein